MSYTLAGDVITFPTQAAHVYVAGRGDVTADELFPAVGGNRNDGPKYLFEAQLGKARDFPRPRRR